MRPPTEAEPTYWFALAAEDAPQHAAVTRLTDRVLEEAIEWFQPATRDALRRWREKDSLSPYWKVTSAERHARELGLPVRGDFTGKLLEAAMYRSQLLVWQHEHVHGLRIDVGFIARDTDHKPRRDGAEEAVKSGRWPFLVVLAFPHPEIEVWPIAVFEPTTKEERKRLEDLALRLGFSPVEHPEKLTSTVTGSLTDTKRVLDALFVDDDHRREGWIELDLEVLRARGGSSGLTDFLQEVKRVAVPLVREGAPPPVE